MCFEKVLKHLNENTRYQRVIIGDRGCLLCLQALVYMYCSFVEDFSWKALQPKLAKLY